MTLSAPLPAQQSSGRYRIAMVCLGNICRSPVAHVVMRHRVAAAGLADVIEIRSGGTAGWHEGKDMDPRSRATLEAAGYDASGHAAATWTPHWRHSEDLVLVMDRANLADVGGPSERVRLFRDFDPLDPGGEVPDPYYGGPQGFTDVLTMVERTCEGLLSAWLADPRHDPGQQQRSTPAP